MLRKLRVKFVCYTMAVVTVLLCVLFATVYSFTSQNLAEESQQMMEAIAADPFQLGRPDSGAEQVRLPYFALQIGPFGEVLAAGGGYFDLSDEDYLNEVIDAALRSGESSGVLKDYGLRFCWGGSRLSRCLVFADMSSERATLNNLLRTCAAAGAAGLAAFFLLSMLLARWAVKPVEEAWKQQKQFVADASHELKTPLTVILTDAELLQEDCPQETREKLSGSVLTMARQMRGLVESLLELARVDGGAVETAKKELDLSALTGEALLPFEPLYFEQGLGLETEIEPGIRVRGSEPHLRQTEEILLDNALKYAEPGSTVELRLKRRGTAHCLLTVTSRGEEISKEDLKNIFKRFYRADKARGMNHSYGLGLAIAESIVAGHGGKIWAESEDGRNRFCVELPSL